MLPSNTAMVNLQWIMCRFDFVGGRCFCLRAISSPSTGVGHLLPRGSRVRILVAPAMSRPHQWFSTAGGEGADRCFGASAKRIPRVDTSSESDRAKSRTICSTKVSRSPGRGLDPGPRSVAGGRRFPRWDCINGRQRKSPRRAGPWLTRPVLPVPIYRPTGAQSGACGLQPRT